MIHTLISSKTRIKLLLKFFLNFKTQSYLRGLETEFGESTNAIRVELNKLEKAGLLSSHHEGNKKIFSANTQHPLFNEIHSILIKYVGLDKVIENVIERLGNVQQVYMVGEFARGLDSQVIDLVLIGDIDQTYLIKLIKKAEGLVHRKIRYLIYLNDDDFQKDWETRKPRPFLLWDSQA